MAKNNRTVLITGTTSGIGEGLMKAFLADGARVICVNRRDQDAHGSLAEGLLSFRADVRVSGDVNGLFSWLSQKKIFPDIYILNAGINRKDNNGNFTYETFEDVMSTNLFGALRFIEKGIALNKNGRKTFVAMSSTSNILPNPNSLGYYISKLGLTKSFEVLRGNYQSDRLIFKTVILGPVRTKMLPSGKMENRLQEIVRDSISVSVEKAVPVLLDFIKGPKAILNYTFFSHVVFHAAHFAKKILPRIYQGKRPVS